MSTTLRPRWADALPEDLDEDDDGQWASCFSTRRGSDNICADDAEADPFRTKSHGVSTLPELGIVHSAETGMFLTSTSSWVPRSSSPDAHTSDSQVMAQVVAFESQEDGCRTQQDSQKLDSPRLEIICNERLQTHGERHSRGSELHPESCRPCSFFCFRRSGCKAGLACSYCHMSHKSKNSEAQSKFKAERQKEKFCRKCRERWKLLVTLLLCGPILESKADNQQDLPSLFGALRSVGSAAHPEACVPCHFYCFMRQGCSHGSDCVYCHMGHVSKGKERRAAYRAKRRPCPERLQP